MAILNLGKEGSNIVEAVVQAVTSGYRDDLVLEELAQAIEDESVSKEQFEEAVDAIDLYLARFTESVKSISNAMRQFEFNDQQSVIKNRPMNLAQQVIKDVEGFNNASTEFYNSNEEEPPPEPEVVDEDEDKQADIDKPKQVPIVVKKEEEEKEKELVKDI